jgi:uncharacterized membrane protein
LIFNREKFQNKSVKACIAGCYFIFYPSKLKTTKTQLFMEAQNNVDDGKTTAIVSYITLIGWLIAYFAMHQSKKTSLGSYHLRQTLLLFICAIVYQIAVYIVTMIVEF